jgi:hypothetical protein
MARTAGHAVNGVEDRRRSSFCMFGAQSANEVIGREGRGVCFRRRRDQGFRERQSTPTRRWLQDDVNILSASKAMGKKDVAGAFGKA